MIMQFGECCFVVEGSFVDCVFVGIYEVMKDGVLDLILLGVNKGNNLGENVVYLGILGVVLEGVFQGVLLIGFL